MLLHQVPSFSAMHGTFSSVQLSLVVLIFLTRACLHDPAIYANPDAFNPERFMGAHPEINPVVTGAFGYGRRICAGRHLALNSSFILIASLLWAFKIGFAKDDQGKEFKPGTGPEDYSDGLLS